jgi:hypothetical protein
LAPLGAASEFLLYEPLVGWPKIAIRQGRTKVDWAAGVAELLRTQGGKAGQLILVCDKLNTRTKGAWRGVPAIGVAGAGASAEMSLLTESTQVG